MSPSPWTDPVIQRLRVLAQLHMPISAIAAALNAEFGTSFTRNAVQGRCDRMGISTGNLPFNYKRHRANKPDAPERPTVKRFTNHGHRFDMVEVYEPPTLPRAYGSLNRHDYPHACSLMDLTNATCRWPVGEPTEPEFFFCGDPTADLTLRRPYCPEHDARSRAG